MRKVIIQSETTRTPIQLIGKESGVCWGGRIDDPKINYKRGLACLKAEHGRTWEFPQIYMIIDEYSARVMREFYTHIGGMSTRLQASTRYIDYKNFEYITPSSIENKPEAKAEYDKAMKLISSCLLALDAYGIPKEDMANLLPLGMTTKVVCRMNLRTLIDMTKQRTCSRAYWEFRDLMFDIWCALCGVSHEWEELMAMFYKPKCEYVGFCTEEKGCGRMPKKEETNELAGNSEK